MAAPLTDVDSILDRVLSAAADVTGARYAALGVLDEQRAGLERFVTHGVSAEEHAQIGDPPSGRGLLGAVIAHKLLRQEIPGAAPAKELVVAQEKGPSQVPPEGERKDKEAEGGKKEKARSIDLYREAAEQIHQAVARMKPGGA